MLTPNQQTHLCATAIVILSSSFAASKIALCTIRSFSVSNALVLSSNSKIFGFRTNARAMAMRWR